ncbi:MAG: hypothetical protein QOI03_2343 [Solirubrobacteraceae bacterium]|jgi:hypothetical protein|nr:hypothetical protein [Solirubrobacteraceae bacterium]
MIPARRTTHRPRPWSVSRRARVALALLLAAVLALAANASGRATPQPRAQTAASYMTGIGDERPQMFGDKLWTQLHMKIVRYIVPYDAAVHPYYVGLTRKWINAAEANHEKILIAFYHSEYTPTHLPSVARYQQDVQKFLRLYPRIKEYQSWDEANRGNVAHAFSSPSAVLAAKYYRALIRACRGCTVAGLDVLDTSVVSRTIRYISEFKHEIGRLHTVMPRFWGLHNYSDVNRFESSRTRALMGAFRGQVWLTETGGIVRLAGTFSNHHGAGLKRAARALKWMFTLAGAHSQIRRLYIFDWTGASATTRFDAGLMDAHDKPRAGYVVVCRHLHGAHCNVKLSSH